MENKETGSIHFSHGIPSRMVTVVYVFIKQITYMTAVEGLYWIPRGIAGILMIGIVFFLTGNKKITNRQLAVLVPYSLVLIEVVLCALIGGDRLIYTFIIGSSLFSLMYLDSAGLFIMMILSGISVSFCAFALNLPMMGIDYAVSDQIFNFLALIILDMIVYMISKFSVGAFAKFKETGQTFDTILETTPNYIVVIDNNAKVTNISKSLAERLGISRREYAANLPLIDIFTTAEIKMLFGNFIRCGGHIEDTFETESDGVRNYYILRSAPTGNGKYARFFEWADITPLMEAKNAAEAATKAKSDFLARTSHEIRTPMNAIMGMSELILRKKLSQEVYENVQNIRSASTNLLSIINDILDFSKIESGMLEIVEDDYEFSSLINDVISVVRMRFVENPIQFAVCIDSKIPAVLRGDEIRVRQILFNLLSNAIKYTEEGSVTLTVMTMGGLADGIVNLEINVSDTGIGIKKEDIGMLFGNFTRLDRNRNKNIEGAGLGLAITKNLCRMMGGDIAVESEYGKGSRFTIILPQRYDSYIPCAVVEKAENKSVLLYETREVYRDSITRTLDILGVRCENAENIAMMFERASEYSYLFISSFMYESVNPALLKLAKAPRLVLISDVKETISPMNAQMLSMPAHAISIANMLNGVNEEHGFASVTGASFTAPEARVLIVDDIAANLKVAEGLMSPYEMKIDICSSGKKSIQMIQEVSYDLVFMDHMMPEMDGLETTAHIRALEGEQYKVLPIVALTANAISGIREMFIQNGMNDFLAKPIEMAKLNAILEKWIPAKKHQSARISNAAESDDFVVTMRRLKWISADKASAMLGGAAAYEKTVRLSVKLIPESIEKLENYIDTDLPLYAIEVHGIKGVLNGIGAYSLGEEALQLEMLSKGGDAEGCKKRHPSFINEVKAFQEAVMLLLGEDEKQKGELFQLSEAITKIEQALDDYDGLLGLELIAPLTKCTYGQPADSLLADLESALEHFDFDKAAGYFNKLKMVMYKK